MVNIFKQSNVAERIINLNTVVDKEVMLTSQSHHLVQKIKYYNRKIWPKLLRKITTGNFQRPKRKICIQNSKV